MGYRKGKTMRHVIVLVLALGLTASAFGEPRVLDEAMTKVEKAEKYQPHRDAGHAAMKAKRFDEASKEFALAANATAFAWVRARMLANAGFALARSSRCKDALAFYNEALVVQELAEEVSSGGTSWAKSRKQTRLDIEWGLHESACAPKKSK